MTFGTGLFCVCMEPRGTWFLDDDCMTYLPCLRCGRTVYWPSVDRVNWHKDVSVIQAGHVKIPIPWRSFKDAERLPARALAEARLSPEFDLKDVVRPNLADRLRDKNPFERLARMAQLVVTGIVMSLPWMIFVLLTICFASVQRALVRCGIHGVS